MILDENPWWQPAWRALCEKWGADGYDALTPEESVWLNTRAVIDEVENGGVISFFYNSSGNTYSDTIAALELLNAAAVAQQLQRVASRFGESVPTSLEQRNAIISGWDGDEETYQLLEQVDSMLQTSFPELERALEGFLRAKRLALPPDVT
jgi:hypothetical protein